jgi:hypothetical protein
MQNISAIFAAAEIIRTHFINSSVCECAAGCRTMLACVECVLIWQCDHSNALHAWSDARGLGSIATWQDDGKDLQQRFVMHAAGALWVQSECTLAMIVKPGEALIELQSALCDSSQALKSA